MMIFQAIEFAARAHSGQYRKGTALPYLIHPLAVMKILIDAGCPDRIRADFAVVDAIALSSEPVGVAPLAGSLRQGWTDVSSLGSVLLRSREGKREHGPWFR